jgi:uncharacterized membrane protein YeaQ/YmgE (transglycosylase-associated protein family)
MVPQQTDAMQKKNGKNHFFQEKAFNDACTPEKPEDPGTFFAAKKVPGSFSPLVFRYGSRTIRASGTRRRIEGSALRENNMQIIGFLIIGALAGWIAGQIMKGGGFGLLGNIVVGIVGAVVGGFLFGLLGLSAGGLLGSLITAVVGAVVLLAVVGLIKKKS